MRLVHHICGALGDWDMPDYVDEAVERIKAQVGTHAM
jgi:GMP synthase (glutamine-hydrolysing)